MLTKAVFYHSQEGDSPGNIKAVVTSWMDSKVNVIGAPVEADILSSRAGLQFLRSQRWRDSDSKPAFQEWRPVRMSVFQAKQEFIVFSVNYQARIL